MRLIHSAFITAACICSFVASLSADVGEKLAFSQKEINLGEIEDLSKPKVVSIEYSNVTDETVAISSVSSSCGCTKWHIDKWELKPKESGVFTLTIDPQQKSGGFTVTGVIEVAGKTPQFSSLIVKGYTIEPIKFAPRRTAISLGRGAMESSLLLTLDKTFWDWSLENVESSTPAINVEPRTAGSSVPGQRGAKFVQQEWIISVKPEADPESLVNGNPHRILFRFNDGKRLREIGHIVTFQMNGSVEIVPASVIAIVSAGQKFEKKLLVRTPSVDPIGSIDVEPTTISVRAISKDKSMRTELHVEASKLEVGEILGRINLKFASGLEKSIPIKILVTE